MSKRILVIVAHSDDEVLGCGGTIARHVLRGDRVSLLIVADGVSSRVNQDEDFKKELALRTSNLADSCKILGIVEYKQLNFGDNRLDSVPLLEIVKEIELYVNEVRPEMIYTHSFNDLNIDHTLVHRAVMTACRPQNSNSWGKTILSFYVPSSSEWTSVSMGKFIPNMFVNIDDTFVKKIEALKCYQLELRPYPHPRSLEGVEVLAKYFGCSVGMEKAEAFIVERIIEMDKK